MRMVHRMADAREHQRTASPSGALRRPVSVSLPEPLLREAKALGLDLSSACENGLAAAVAEARAAVWRSENAAAIDAWNDYVEANGIPLHEFRQF
jgi:antitoxin CcdA